MEHIRSKCQISGPKEVIASVSAEAGGIITAVYPGELPRDEQQVSQFKRRLPKSTHSGPSHSYNDDDELYTIMLQAQLEDREKYARDIKMHPEPAILLVNDRQLNDLSRFSCNPFQFCILTVDPTFCLGDFDVTPITYRHLLLESIRTGKPPVMIGPTLIHYKKSFQTYLFFASSLIGQKKDLVKIRAFGTDGEKALIDAFSHEFRFAVHLLCFIHVRKNIKEKLSACSISDTVQTEILGDIFGKKVGSTLLEGLVDSEDVVSFEDNAALLLEKWMRNEDELVAIEEFCRWFVKNKVDVIRKSMLRSVREEAGLGSPPEPFYTNSSECVNSIIKMKVGYKRNELPQFVAKLRELCDEQEREVERAVIRRGKYRLRPQYKQLEVDEGKWFSMSQDQRLSHLKKFSATEVSSIDCPEAITFCGRIGSLTPPTPACIDDDFSSVLSDLLPVASHVGLPISAVDAIGKKAIDILKTADGIVPAPGHGKDSRMVLSRSGKMPHLVSIKKNGGMACDKDCPQYQSAGICSHIVAAAMYNKKFDQFVASYTKVTRKPNLTKLVTGEMPKGRGRKGCKAPSKRKTSAPVDNRCKMISAPSSSLAGSAVSIATVNNSFNSAPAPSPCYMPSPISFYPTYPPPYYGHPPVPHVDVSGSTQHPFRLHFVAGNISVCHGCRGNYHKELGPPHDLCVQHEEWRTYNVPGLTSPQSRFGNVYYHANIACIFVFWPSFVATALLVPVELHASLKREHKEWLISQFGLHL